MNRRGFLLGTSAVLAAPAIIRIPGLLMPIKPPAPPAVDLRLLCRLGGVIPHVEGSIELARLRKARLDYLLHSIKPPTTEAFADLVCYGRSAIWVDDQGQRALRPIEPAYAEAIMQAISPQ